MKVWHKSTTIRAALLAVGSAVAALPALGPALADETIKIGVPMSLSGRFVSYGASGKRGVEMAAEAFGSTINGRKIEFLYRDVQSDPQATMSAVNELINSQDVDFLIGPTASPIAAAAIPPWQQGKPIWILNGGSTTAVEELLGGEERFFHTYPYSYHYHTSELNALKHYLGDGKKVAVIYADDTYGQSHLPFVQKFYSEAGFEIVAEEMIRRIHVRGPHAIPNQHMLRRPRSPMAAQYSLPFVVGATLAVGPTRFDAYREENLNDPTILAIADKVEASADDEIERHFPDHFGTAVEITLADGTTRCATVMDSIGTPARPMSLDDVKAKALSLIAPLDRSFDVDALFDAIVTLQQHGCRRVEDMVMTGRRVAA